MFFFMHWIALAFVFHSTLQLFGFAIMFVLCHSIVCKSVWNSFCSYCVCWRWVHWYFVFLRFCVLFLINSTAIEFRKKVKQNKKYWTDSRLTGELTIWNKIMCTKLIIIRIWRGCFSGDFTFVALILSCCNEWTKGIYCHFRLIHTIPSVHSQYNGSRGRCWPNSIENWHHSWWMDNEF